MSFTVTSNNMTMGTVFDTDHRYVRQVANSNDGTMWMVEGPSMAVTFTTGEIFWRFECGPLTFTTPSTAPAAGFATDRLIGV